MGDFLDVSEGVVAVEPGEKAGGWYAQQEHTAWTQNASRLGECLLLEHRQRQHVKQNNRVVRGVRVRPIDYRWHKTAAILSDLCQRTRVERMPVDPVAGLLQLPRDIVVTAQEQKLRSLRRWQ